MRGRSASIDSRLEWLAGAGGVVTAGAMRGAGIDAETIRVRVAAGWMARAERGLYVIEHLRNDITPIALVQARYPRSVAAGRTAAWLYGMDGFDCVHELLPDVVDHPDHQISRPVRPLPPNFLVTPVARRDVVLVRGVRTLAMLPALTSLGTVADVDAVEAAVEWTLRKAKVSAEILWEWAGNRPATTPGLETLRAALDQRGRWTPVTESYLETLTVQKVLRPAGLAHSRQVSVWINDSFLGRYDFELECGLLVEASGAATHATPVGLQRDASHGMRLRLAGRQVEHLTWDDVTKRPWFTGRRLQEYVRQMGEVAARLQQNEHMFATVDV